MRVALIMAGGSGERFWPMSRADRPKQLLDLAGTGRSLLGDAVHRVSPMGFDRIILAVGPALGPSVMASGIVPPTDVWVEPSPRNTLGALAWASANLVASGEQDSQIAVLTADHAIGDETAFQAAVQAAMDAAHACKRLVTLGIQPTRPETGYGYIEVGRAELAPGVFPVTRFVEKPNAEVASELFESGNHLWNSGMLFFDLPVWLSELEAAQPESHAAVMQLAGSLDNPEPFFSQVPSISVDYAVLERSHRVAVMRGTFPWDDLGSWDSLSRTPREQWVLGDATLLESADSIVHNHLDMPLAVVGIDDVIVVATPDGILVCHRDYAQRVRDVARILRERSAR
jgi:mannose-1-phosphate guanylyltransferase